MRRSRLAAAAPTCSMPCPMPWAGLPHKGDDVHEQVVGRKQESAEDQADREDIGPDGGEVHFQQSASGRAR